MPSAGRRFKQILQRASAAPRSARRPTVLLQAEARNSVHRASACQPCDRRAVRRTVLSGDTLYREFALKARTRIDKAAPEKSALFGHWRGQTGRARSRRPETLESFSRPQRDALRLQSSANLNGAAKKAPQPKRRSPRCERRQLSPIY